MEDARSVPSRSDLRDQLERLFGTPAPDFDAQAERLQQLRRRVAEARDERFATEWFQVYGRPLELGRLASARWEELGDRAKRQIVEELQSADAVGEEMNYLPAAG
ncbi:MAG: hypothetical protein ABEK75_03555 [Salinibacter sp.]